MLRDIQQQLEERFAKLAAERRELNYPVYAIEHGLEDAALLDVREAASQSIQHHSPSDTHWLVWAVLGAEAGYGYSGDEYWPQLEVRPGEWRSNDYRQALRRFYQRFARELGGPTPGGRWAQQFSIIAWPIKHAILPRYLQSQFARHLYDLRYALARLAAGDGEGLGELLLDGYDGSSSRFRDFLQQTELTAQIVLALRDEDLGDQAARIEAPLLRRIVTDLETRRDARSYLRDARKLIHGTSIKVSSRLQMAAGSKGEPASANLAAPQRPRLVGRRQSDGTFLLGLQLPDISRALVLGGVTSSALNGPRVRFPGEQDRPLPASNLLTLSLKERRLSAFPEAGTRCFTIENPPPALSYVLEPISRLEERSWWVLRRQAGGLYREVLGGHVRAGQEYLVLSRAAARTEAAQAAGFVLAGTQTRGVVAYRLSTPSRLDNAQKVALESLGIGTITGVSIEPVGLNPAPSSSGGRPTWLSTEPVTLRIKADFQAEAFLIEMDGQEFQKFPCTDGELILQLDHLESGSHMVRVSVWTRDARPAQAESFEFQLVTPRPWVAAMRGKAGFRLFVEPEADKIEQLFDAAAKLNLIGPAGRSVHWSLETYNAAGHFEGTLPIGSAKVGSPDSTLQSLLARARADHADAIDEASRLDIVAALDELGRQAVSFQHIVEPLRWKYDSRKGMIRLVDETDHSEPLAIREYPLETPLAGKALELAQVLAGYTVSSPGALLVATRKNHRIPIFVSAPGRLRELEDLQFSQTLGLPDAPASAMVRLIDGLRRWVRAKPVGQLGPVRKATTVERLRDEIAILACGHELARELASPRFNPERAQKKVGGSPGFGWRMREHQWPRRLESALVKFSEFAGTYGVEHDSDWCRAALTLAYNPLILQVPAGVDSRAYFDELLGKQVLLRGAFLAVAARRLRALALKATG